MDLHNGQLGARELFQAQSHIYKHAFSFANSMSLNCAVQLGIPDIIHNHKKPISLPDLVSSLQLPPSKINALHRLMSLLTHLGFFATTKLDPNHGDQEGYVLTPSSRLLIKSELPNLSPVFQMVADPVLLAPLQFFGDWLRGNEETAFETAHGVGIWEFCDKNPKFNNLFNEGMASDSRMMSLVIRDCEAVFGGLNSLVDVGGGTGIFAQIISEAFPSMKCTVFDLPHVVKNLPEGKNLNYVGGDMFQSFPSADAIFFKCVLHNWSDEDCVKILKICREAIPSKEGGKVIIIDIVVDRNRDEHDITEAKLVSDIFMMLLAAGRERSEKEWEKIFLEAGFSLYKITPIFGLRSLIEVYP
ncbi:Trans-resveratrol di-O-methyltransferase [Camellia lanceoleosa]|uniref:Trans-resveratrol di-O-methyltransferase n=1 Tax=Camellia lanceoleosa TaxID=1840588 RepID=A0ACC0GET5_9ERIC|nr:Trans-resveratrol di-O-methyltransferase [Camellia lanceoleosa]